MVGGGIAKVGECLVFQVWMTHQVSRDRAYFLPPPCCLRGLLFLNSDIRFLFTFTRLTFGETFQFEI